MSEEAGLITQLQEVGKYMMDNDLAWGNAGNISARSSENEFLITASGTYMGELGGDDFVACSLSGSNATSDKKPSKEVPMHTAIYSRRPEITAVLHASPFYSTLIACSDIAIPSELFVESMYYLERVERVPYEHPGSEALGKAVEKHAEKANVLLLENHGVLVFDESIKEARMALQTLEFASKMLVEAKSAGIDLNKLPYYKVHEFLHHAGYKPRRRWEGS
ncbi:class II aldolase/adducin family protein [Thalassobacillus pellis]|uniref:class II aldolase/adducin family protein n=1 Tax=Thalassobacillus pellis TaxID=748008 RepID=UPI001961AAA2|nr:class II aldolase/adducin family protein [Thalassobacillus pellis]MBM7551540.1 L-fuculose-phosphate aldolase [Thalassobacillus pellis]